MPAFFYGVRASARRRTTLVKPGRNDPCPCGSGRKYKKCCGAASAAAIPSPSPSPAPMPVAVARPEAQALLVIGNSQHARGEFDAAVASYRRALAIEPDAVLVLANLGNALRDLGQLPEAVAVCLRAVELRPDFALAHRFLGNALFDSGRFDDAVASYRRALALKPGDGEVLFALAMVLRQMGRSAEAFDSARLAVQVSPDSGPTLTLFGEIQADRGEFDAAQSLFRRALAVSPDLPEAWAAIARYRRMGPEDADWLGTAQRLLTGPLYHGQKINLRHALGKYFDDLGDYAQAFPNYRIANELAGERRSPYDAERLVRRVDMIIAHYDALWMQTVRAHAHFSARPVFVIGMPRSGTTLVEQIIASHPAAFGAGELRFWHAGAAEYEAGLRNGTIGHEAIAALSEAYLATLQEYSADAVRVVDKMPANFLNLGLIHAALPQAKIIHVQRDPIDTCLSIYFQVFSMTHAYANDLGDLAHYYRQYRRVMAHWREVLPADAVLELPYEALIDDQEGWSRRLIEFIGLPWDPKCLEFHATNRTVVTASNWQVRQKISRASVGRWRHYEQFIGPLRDLVS